MSNCGNGNAPKCMMNKKRRNSKDELCACENSTKSSVSSLLRDKGVEKWAIEEWDANISL